MASLAMHETKVHSQYRRISPLTNCKWKRISTIISYSQRQRERRATKRMSEDTISDRNHPFSQMWWVNNEPVVTKCMKFFGGKDMWQPRNTLWIRELTGTRARREEESTNCANSFWIWFFSRSTSPHLFHPLCTYPLGIFASNWSLYRWILNTE